MLLIGYLDDITNTYPTWLSYPCKNAFSRHDTVAYLMKNCAVIMAFFPKLCNLKLNTLTKLKLTAEVQIAQIYSLSRDVFRKIARTNVSTPGHHLFYGFGGK